MQLEGVVHTVHLCPRVRQPCFPLQHFIFVGVAVIAWLIPDVPEAVQQEIKKEKLLALEATLKAKGGEAAATGGTETSTL